MAVAGVLLGWLIALTPEVAAAVDPCPGFDGQGYCVEWSSGGTSGVDGGNGAANNSGDEMVCYWSTLGEVSPTEVESGLVVGAPVDVPLVWQERVCSDGSRPADGIFNIRWTVAAEVSPVDLAYAARVRLSRLLSEPVVVSSPPEGTAAIVSVPVFVAVSNWTGRLTESECGAGLCVTVVAEPQLSFSPGEPGSEVIECSGAGTRHVEGADPIVEAEQPGACAHPYLLRTGVADRPEAWPGVVSVTWVISWSSSGGASGTLPAVSRSVPLPRPVDEVQSVVVDGRLP